MTVMYEHTDRDSRRLAISTLEVHADTDDVVIHIKDQGGEWAGVYARRADLVAALGGVTEQEFADMSTLAAKNLTRYETALAERDRARDTAARLESENADLAEEVAELTELNRRQRNDLRRLRVAEENREFTAGVQGATLAGVTDRLDALLDAVTALKPRVTKTRVEYHVVTPESAHRHDCD